MKSNEFIGKYFVAKDSEETEKLGEDFAKYLEGGDIVALYGDLGSGKTTFTKGLAKGLGIKDRVISPTFIIQRTHSLKKGKLIHMDLYRLGQNNIGDLGLEEILNDKNNIVVIEWAERIQNLLPKKRVDIKFFYNVSGSREIEFSSGEQ